MATSRKRTTTRMSSMKAGAGPRGVTSRTRAGASSDGRRRRAPGAGGGNYYRVAVRSKAGFVTFRTQDVGEKGHIQRVAGRRSSGSWATVTWLIGKEDAHVEHGRLIPDTAPARQLLRQLGSAPVHTQGDRFEALDRPNVPERAKPTAAQRRARSANIKKAQAVRRRRT